jgi:uncharacterized protein (DUF1697 family)
MGFSNVETYIQSGNVIFDHNSDQIGLLKNEIEQHLLANLEFEVPSFVRTHDQLDTLTKTWPFTHDHGVKGDTLYVSFLSEPPTSEVAEAIHELSSEVEEFSVVSNNVFWLYHRDKGRSKVTNSKVERVVGQPSTRRNMNTIKKIVRKFANRS